MATTEKGTFVVKAGLAKMLKGGVIMGKFFQMHDRRAAQLLITMHPPPDVINVEQARIAEEAGAVAVMALERIPADIRRDGGVARMSDPELITAIKNAVTIPVMAKVSRPFHISAYRWHFNGFIAHIIENIANRCPSCHRRESGTLSKLRFWSHWKWIMSMKARC